MSSRFFFSCVVVAGGLVACVEPTEALPRAKAHWTQCSPCHGELGEGRHDQLAPPIAGLPAWYVESQIVKFKTELRGNHFDDLPGLRMRPMAMALITDQDVKDMAAYVATLPDPGYQQATIDGHGPSATGAFATCTACHGADGAGNKVMNAPPIAGQPDWYVLEQLKKFKTGMRGADPKDITGQQMRAIAMTLGDDTAVHNMARYVADMPVKRPREASTTPASK